MEVDVGSNDGDCPGRADARVQCGSRNFPDLAHPGQWSPTSKGDQKAHVPESELRDGDWVPPPVPSRVDRPVGGQWGFPSKTALRAAGLPDPLKSDIGLSE